jgi:hypothetical protein
MVGGLGGLPLGVYPKDGSSGIVSSPSHNNPNAWDCSPIVPASGGALAGPWMLSCEVPCGLYKRSLGIALLYVSYVNTC